MVAEVAKARVAGMDGVVMATIAVAGITRQAAAMVPASRSAILATVAARLETLVVDRAGVQAALRAPVPAHAMLPPIETVVVTDALLLLLFLRRAAG